LQNRRFWFIIYQKDILKAGRLGVKMTAEKQKRLIVAGVVGAVLLALILISVMVYQLIAIGVANKRKAELETAIAEYKQLVEDGDDLLAERSTYQWIVRRARQLGYVFDGDKLYETNDNANN
jgi:uncharacterized membrane protein